MEDPGTSTGTLSNASSRPQNTGEVDQMERRTPSKGRSESKSCVRVWLSKVARTKRSAIRDPRAGAAMSRYDASLSASLVSKRSGIQE